MAEAVKRPGEEMNHKDEPKLSQDEGEAQKATASPPRNQRRSTDHSPMHPYYQAKLGTKGNGVSSPSWERKSSSDSSHGLPGRSRMKSTPRGNETPEKGASVPKFGDWDENDPSSADGYSHIFNLVREERQAGPGSTPSIAAHRDKFRNNTSKGCWCFPWGRN